ncbi:PREDICTED: uncharacterized protein LOC104590261 [Nelumbo nucifera]|uniref:Chlororespiratory reduction 42 n=2 Tax=Nelumbo nucifera TaxID=4432 RepID=A0A822YDE7_NELNU|nr:PREDICTED: uncharacterized protein LOC104590261 [Nelumbo nucifera]DAD29076.1 TPA_asm: hypothetical protein HUJ06_030544 [Nelumbo nucifera]
MAFSLSSTLIPQSKLPSLQPNHLNPRIRNPSSVVVIKCESTPSSPEADSSERNSKLQIGSPIIVTEAPKTLKTAASVPCLRLNEGLVKEGDVGRIVARKPKDVWAVRLAIGTYLLDGKYFRPLDLRES